MHPETHGIEPSMYEKRWWTLGVLCLSLSIIMVSNGSLNVALPSLAKDLHASSSELQWIVDAYSLVFAGMLFAAGTLGDRFGRKGALQGGLLLFLVAAAAGVISNSATQVIAARGVMGIAAAFVMPSTLSILTNIFPAHERAKAISMWAGISAGGAALGPPISGFLLEHFWWGSVFLVNVPLVLAALILGRKLVPKSKNPDEHRLDVPGAVLSIFGVGALVYAIIEAPRYGWLSSHTLVAFAAAVLGVGAFIVRERQAAQPMLDLGLFGDRRFSVASAGITVAFFTMFGISFVLTQYMQLVLGKTALQAGLFFLPFPLVMMVMAPRAPKLVGRFGVARVASAGLTLVAIGLALMTTLGVDTPVWHVYLGLLPMATGMSITASPLTSLIMSAVPRHRAGMGSAMNDTTRELGGALGVAVLGSLLATTYSSSIGDALRGLSPDAASQARSGLAGALESARELGGDTGSALTRAARGAFVDGFGVAGWVGSAVVLTSAVAAWFLLPRHAAAHSDEAAARPVDVPASVVEAAGLGGD